MEDQQFNIVFFDGYCNLCNGSVNFLMKIDRRKRLRYASLQGETAKQYLNMDISGVDSVLFYKDKMVYDRSEALLEIAGTVGGIWKLAFVIRIIPRSWRDHMYDLIARNRYSWFGKKDHCRVPTEEESKLFLP